MEYKESELTVFQRFVTSWDEYEVELYEALPDYCKDELDQALEWYKTTQEYADNSGDRPESIQDIFDAHDEFLQERDYFKHGCLTDRYINDASELRTHIVRVYDNLQLMMDRARVKRDETIRRAHVEYEAEMKTLQKHIKCQ